MNRSLTPLEASRTAEYNAVIAKVQAEIARLQAGLDKLSAQQAIRPRDWGFIGTALGVLDVVKDQADAMNGTGEYAA